MLRSPNRSRIASRSARGDELSQIVLERGASLALQYVGQVFVGLDRLLLEESHVVARVGFTGLLGASLDNVCVARAAQVPGQPAQFRVEPRDGCIAEHLPEGFHDCTRSPRGDAHLVYALRVDAFQGPRMMPADDLELLLEIAEQERQYRVVFADICDLRFLEQRIHLQPGRLQAALELAVVCRHQARLVAEQRGHGFEVRGSAGPRFEFQLGELQDPGCLLGVFFSVDPALVEIEFDVHRPRAGSLELEHGAAGRYAEQLHDGPVSEYAVEFFPDRPRGERQRCLAVAPVRVLADFGPHVYVPVCPVQGLQRHFFVSVPSADSTGPAGGEEGPVRRVVIAVDVRGFALWRNAEPAGCEHPQCRVDLLRATNDEFGLDFGHSMPWSDPDVALNRQDYITG